MKTLWFWNKNKYFGEKKGKEKKNFDQWTNHRLTHMWSTDFLQRS